MSGASGHREQSGVMALHPVTAPAADDQRAAAIIVAAGNSTRMGGVSKQMVRLDGVPVIVHTLRAFQRAETVREIVLVTRPREREEMAALCREHGVSKVTYLTDGGETRQQSVARGVALTECGYFAIHDGARPLILPDNINRVVRAAWECGAAAAAVPSKDTVKVVDEAGWVRATPDRRKLWNVQTPQVFARTVYLAALNDAVQKGADCTDDCQLLERFGHSVRLIRGDYSNLKLTTPEDIACASALLRERGGAGSSASKEEARLRIGHGYDVHRLAEGRRLIVGGVEIPHDRGLLGHSDADVLAHAVADALLGAAGMGDIGGMFPDTDPAFQDADSIDLLRRVTARIHAAGWRVGNVDATIVAQAPKFKPYIPAMRERLAEACGTDADCVNVKATTEETLGFTGRREGISAHAACLLL